MNVTEFEEHVLSGDRTEYVDVDAIHYLRDTASFRVIDKSAMDKNQIDQTEFVSVSTSGESYSDGELIDRVKDAMESTADIQKYQFRHGDDPVSHIEIWRHGSGYSAFALAE